MLSIIPKEVLASLGNIHKILDIGNTVKPKNNRMVENGQLVNQPAVTESNEFLK
jgi:hypothetical protein